MCVDGRNEGRGWKCCTGQYRLTKAGLELIIPLSDTVRSTKFVLYLLPSTMACCTVYRRTQGESRGAEQLDRRHKSGRPRNRQLAQPRWIFGWQRIRNPLSTRHRKNPKTNERSELMNRVGQQRDGWQVQITGTTQ